MLFEILIASFNLFVCFEIKNREQFRFNVKSFAKRLLNNNDKLKLLIEHY